MSKTYSELIKIPTFIERFRYLNLDGRVGKETFGFDRYFSQVLYHSKEWQSVRRDIIVRDLGNDLGMPGFEIYGKILIHHIEPISLHDLETRDPKVLDPDNLIATSFNTHNAIHYGDEHLLCEGPTIRKPNDTTPWKKENSNE